MNLHESQNILTPLRAAGMPALYVRQGCLALLDGTHRIFDTQLSQSRREIETRIAHFQDMNTNLMISNKIGAISAPLEARDPSDEIGWNWDGWVTDVSDGFQRETGLPPVSFAMPATAHVSHTLSERSPQAYGFVRNLAGRCSRFLRTPLRLPALR